jgi:hypothetical protein
MVKFIYGTRRRKSKSSNKKAKDSSSDFGGNTYSALKDEREDKLLDEAFCTEMQTDHSLVNLNTPSSKKKKRTKEYLSLNDGKGSLKDAKGQKNNNDNRSRFFTHKYVAKPSSRMQHIFSGDKAIKADGETWIERVVIIERNVSQTYFIALESHNAFWDEPPTGASRIILIGEEGYPDAVEPVHLKGKGPIDWSALDYSENHV